MLANNARVMELLLSQLLLIIVNDDDEVLQKLIMIIIFREVRLGGKGGPERGRGAIKQQPHTGEKYAQSCRKCNIWGNCEPNDLSNCTYNKRKIKTNIKIYNLKDIYVKYDSTSFNSQKSH